MTELAFEVDGVYHLIGNSWDEFKAVSQVSDLITKWIG